MSTETRWTCKGIIFESVHVKIWLLWYSFLSITRFFTKEASAYTICYRTLHPWQVRNFKDWLVTFIGGKRVSPSQTGISIHLLWTLALLPKIKRGTVNHERVLRSSSSISLKIPTEKETFQDSATEVFNKLPSDITSTKNDFCNKTLILLKNRIQ